MSPESPTTAPSVNTDGLTALVALGARPRLLKAGTGSHGHGRGRRESYQLHSWALHAYPYEAEMELLERRVVLAPGTAGLTPPGVRVTYFYPGPVQHRYVHFELAGGRAPRLAVPLLTREPAVFARVWDGLGELARDWRGPELRAEVALWDLLWLLAQRGAKGEEGPVGGRHPALETALAIIEDEIATPLRLGELARRASISPNHLIRLFRTHLGGQTVAAYVSRRRAELARHLLRHTTLPAKVVGASVGLADLQRFNKTLRREFGAGPRALRDGAA